MIKKKILIICPYPEGQAAGQRLKYEQYFDYWKLKNYELTVSSYFGLKAWKILYKPGFFFNKFLSIIYGNLQRIKEVFLLNQYDVIYIFMYVTPLGSTFFERLFRMFGKKIIYDFDDSIHLKENYKNNTSLNPFVGFFKSPNKSNYLINTIKEQYPSVWTKKFESETVEHVKKAVELEQAEVSKELGQLEKERGQLQAQVDQHSTDRLALVAEIPSTAMALFDTLSRGRKGVAVGEARDGRCSECLVRLRPQLYNEVRRNASLIQCDSCQRILYYRIESTTSTTSA